MAPNNTLPIHGNEKTMNLNNMILTNIQSSPYFKVNLFELKTYHEVVDEIYYKVTHLEPWEKGSRKTAGQTGMCGGVRGVGAGGIVSSAFCLLYKLYTLKLTRKQLNGLLTHTDSCYIRGLGFMYIRYTQPPADLWEWYEPYLDDEEEIDVKAGGGHVMTMGEMVRQFLGKLEWYSTLFPRVPVPVQKSIESKLQEYEQQKRMERLAEKGSASNSDAFGEAERMAHSRQDSPYHSSSRRPTPPFDIAKEMQRKRSRSHSRSRSKRSRSRDRRRRSRSHDRRSRSRDKRLRDEDRRKRSRSRDRKHRSRSRDRRSRSRDRRRRSRSPGHSRHKHSHSRHSREQYSRERDSKHSRESSFERDLRRERDRVDKERRARERNGDYY